MTQRQDIELLIESLESKKQRRRMTLYYFRGYTKTEIARKEGVTCSAIVHSISAAIALLGKKWGKIKNF